MDQRKIDLIIQDASCQISQGPVTGEPRKQTVTYTSNIGVVSQVITWPNAVGHSRQGENSSEWTLDSYTGPELDEYGYPTEA